MQRYTVEEKESTPHDFAQKVNDLDFDPWDSEEHDGAARRLDPLRRLDGRRPSEEVTGD